ncbi:MAG: 4-hydroxy-3-methylbut-2-enyl diphosphate reductase [Candidatus Omnitrophica bacterium CG08_land_8_20_14_0_20_41_16]|uniref:4-hydroxy-3-methylbut-2-enyl diphosphate reductase n=1 Tax=Candidatus Sherwoodlollariibacterium unditelluris TaxID=1974757 RepID=A0A2G9YHY5_9BACT|nr:MAG: 4-hydroxy-3-methylbut-2-enyl diphosphate reductase [Candidatus Omnitrophica bacterium CG23_combo_of_CG06-09_8_20_14_all_41_10]PIS33502.1 MAG: 4-hydroxy-3-methylbut-2-enyl diphosphate reductase [Candidatus Omnitrophica bacterium CG08_land_8_20_14_0_20_41_16]
MQINIAKSAGFCFGVKRALQIAHKAAVSGGNIFMLGDIVHNEAVVKAIERAGIKKIKSLSRRKNGILLIRAHGVSAKTITKAKSLGFGIIDATCPMVKEIHRIVRESKKQGYYIIVIGEATHDEVKGIVGQVNNRALVIDSSGNIPIDRIKKIKKAAVVVQSTQNIEQVVKIIGALKQHIPNVRFFNTVCKPTRTKQEEINSLSLQNEAMVIIGSRTSANTKRLFEISKSLNRKSYWISSKDELKPKWFRGVLTVGVTAGASTPEATIKEITATILHF